QPEEGQVFAFERIREPALNIQHADDLVIEHQRQTKLGTGVVQQWVIDKRFTGQIQRVLNDDGFSGLGGASNDRIAGDRDLELFHQHLTAHFAATAYQHGVLADVIQQEDLRVIEIQLTTDHLDRTVEQLVQIIQSGGCT